MSQWNWTKTGDSALTLVSAWFVATFEWIMRKQWSLFCHAGYWCFQDHSIAEYDERSDAMCHDTRCALRIEHPTKGRKHSDGIDFSMVPQRNKNGNVAPTKSVQSYLHSCLQIAGQDNLSWERSRIQGQNEKSNVQGTKATCSHRYHFQDYRLGVKGRRRMTCRKHCRINVDSLLHHLDWVCFQQM